MQEEETTPTGDKQEEKGDTCAADMPMEMIDPPPPHPAKDAPETDVENDEEQNSCYQTTDAWRDTGEAGEGYVPSSYG